MGRTKKHYLFPILMTLPTTEYGLDCQLFPQLPLTPIPTSTMRYFPQSSRTKGRFAFTEVALLYNCGNITYVF